MMRSTPLRLRRIGPFALAALAVSVLSEPASLPAADMVSPSSPAAIIADAGTVRFEFSKAEIYFDDGSVEAGGVGFVWDTAKPAACADGINNDDRSAIGRDRQDDAVDFPSDPECASESDASEDLAGDQPGGPVLIGARLEADGRLVLGDGAAKFPGVYVYERRSGIARDSVVTYQFMQEGAGRGWINPFTREVGLVLPLAVRIGSGEDGCRIGDADAPLWVRLSTVLARSAYGAATGKAYNAETGAIELVGTTAYAIDGAQGCGMFGAANASVNRLFGLPRDPATVRVRMVGTMSPTPAIAEGATPEMLAQVMAAGFPEPSRPVLSSRSSTAGRDGLRGFVADIDMVGTAPVSSQSSMARAVVSEPEEKTSQADEGEREGRTPPKVVEIPKPKASARVLREPPLPPVTRRPARPAPRLFDPPKRADKIVVVPDPPAERRRWQPPDATYPRSAPASGSLPASEGAPVAPTAPAAAAAPGSPAPPSAPPMAPAAAPPLPKTETAVPPAPPAPTAEQANAQPPAKSEDQAADSPSANPPAAQATGANAEAPTPEPTAPAAGEPPAPTPQPSNENDAQEKEDPEDVGEPPAASLPRAEGALDRIVGSATDTAGEAVGAATEAINRAARLEAIRKAAAQARSAAAGVPASETSASPLLDGADTAVRLTKPEVDPEAAEAQPDAPVHAEPAAIAESPRELDGPPAPPSPEAADKLPLRYFPLPGE